MCGLVGMVGKIATDEKKMFKQMLHLDVLRGDHSTGVACIPVDRNKIGVYKQIGPATELLDSIKFDKALAQPMSCLIGHNRYATKGAINKANAHPFEADNVIGAHNGTLRNWKGVLPHAGLYDVDSEALMNAFSSDGVENIIPKLDGAFALTWYDYRNDTVNLLRNSERPLHVAYSKSGETIFWASEKWMLEVSASKCNIQLKETFSLKEGTLLAIDVPVAAPYLVKPFTKEQVATKEIPFFVPPPVKNYQQKGNGQKTYLEKQREEEYKDKIVNFKIVGYQEKTNFYKTPFIKGHVLGKPYVETRIYIDKNTPKGSEIFEINRIGSSKCMAVVTSGSTVLTLSSKDFKEVSSEGKSKKVADFIYRGPNKTMLTAQQYLDKTSIGCCCCGAIPTLGESATVDWLTDDEFLCRECSMEQAWEQEQTKQ